MADQRGRGLTRLQHLHRRHRVKAGEQLLVQGRGLVEIDQIDCLADEVKRRPFQRREEDLGAIYQVDELIFFAVLPVLRYPVRERRYIWNRRCPRQFAVAVAAA